MSTIASSTRVFSVSRAQRTDFHVVPCGKGGLASGPGPKKRSTKRKWMYPSYVTTFKQKWQYRRDTLREEREQRLENLGFYRCLICKQILKRKEEFQCANKGCTAYFHKSCVEAWFATIQMRKCPHCQQYFDTDTYLVRYNNFHLTLDQNFFDADNLHISCSDGSNNVNINIIPLIRQKKTMGYYFLGTATTYSGGVEYSNDAGGISISDDVSVSVQESLQNSANNPCTLEEVYTMLQTDAAFSLCFLTQNYSGTSWENVQGVALMSELASNFAAMGMQRQYDEIDEGWELEADFSYADNSNFMWIHGSKLATYIRANGIIW